jgi:hypothetical protein
VKPVEAKVNPISLPPQSKVPTTEPTMSIEINQFFSAFAEAAKAVDELPKVQAELAAAQLGYNARGEIIAEADKAVAAAKSEIEALKLALAAREAELTDTKSAHAALSNVIGSINAVIGRFNPVPVVVPAITEPSPVAAESSTVPDSTLTTIATTFVNDAVDAISTATVPSQDQSAVDPTAPTVVPIQAGAVSTTNTDAAPSADGSIPTIEDQRVSDPTVSTATTPVGDASTSTAPVSSANTSVPSANPTTPVDLRPTHTELSASEVAAVYPTTPTVDTTGSDSAPSISTLDPTAPSTPTAPETVSSSAPGEFTGQGYWLKPDGISWADWQSGGGEIPSWLSVGSTS